MCLRPAPLKISSSGVPSQLLWDQARASWLEVKNKAPARPLVPPTLGNPGVTSNFQAEAYRLGIEKFI